MKSLSNIEHKTPVKDSEYLYDESRLKGENVKNIWIPKNEEEIAQILSDCNKRNIPVTVYAKGTGITGAAVAFDGDIISMEKFNSISGIGYDGENRPFLRVQANVELTQINEVLLKKDLAKVKELTEGALKTFFKDDIYFYPVDPTEMGASIGGTVATNASGARSYRFGPTRKWIKALKVVFIDGSVETIRRGQYLADSKGIIEFRNNTFRIPDYNMPDCKNAAGYFSEKELDLIDLFIGSEGTLGIIIEAEIWLKKLTPKMSVIQFFDQGQRAFEFVAALKSSQVLRPDFIEYIDGNGLAMIRAKNSESGFLNIPDINENWQAAVFYDIDIDKAEDFFEEIERISQKTDQDINKTWCAWEKIEIERVKMFRHALPETVNLHIAKVQSRYPTVHKLGTDFSVNDDNFRKIMDFSIDLIKKNNLNYVVFGHIGDNHVHINMLPENDDDLKKGKAVYAQMAGKAVELGGTVSAEHGIGKIKHNYIEIMYGKHGIDEMRRIKKHFDPLQLLNRNNIFRFEA